MASEICVVLWCCSGLVGKLLHKSASLLSLYINKWLMGLFNFVRNVIMSSGECLMCLLYATD